MRNPKVMVEARQVTRPEKLAARHMKRLKREVIEFKYRRNREEGKIARRQALLARAEKAREKTAVRNAYRQKIAKLHKVNWRRVRIVDWKKKVTVIK